MVNISGEVKYEYTCDVCNVSVDINNLYTVTIDKDGFIKRHQLCPACAATLPIVSIEDMDSTKVTYE